MENNFWTARMQLLETGVFIDPMTPADQIQGLINQLHPVKTGLELIRIGGAADGGYLVPNDMAHIGSCFSPGVDQIAHFEKDMLAYGVKSHLADYSVEKVPGGIQVASFTKKFLGAVNDDMFMTLDAWVKAAPEYHGVEDLVLQMDIEGGEYETFLSTSDEVLRRFRWMVVEFHNVESWGQRHYFDLVKATFKKVLKHFHVVHNHPNNACGTVNLAGVVSPRVFELTFVRKDRATADGFVSSLPHVLDRPNIPQTPDLTLPPNWFGEVSHA